LRVGRQSPDPLHYIYEKEERKTHGNKPARMAEETVRVAGTISPAAERHGKPVLVLNEELGIRVGCAGMPNSPAAVLC